MINKTSEHFLDLSKKILNGLLYNKSYIRSGVFKKRYLLLLDNYNSFIIKRRKYIKKRKQKKRLPYIMYTGLDFIASKRAVSSKSKLKRKFRLKKGFSINTKKSYFSGNFRGFVVSFFWESIFYNSSLKVLKSFNRSLHNLEQNQKFLWFLKPQKGGFTVYSQGIFGFMSKRNSLISILIVTVYFVILYRFKHKSKKLKFMILKLFKKRKSIFNKKLVFRFVYKRIKIRLVSFKKKKVFSKIRFRTRAKKGTFCSNIQIFFTIVNKPKEDKEHNKEIKEMDKELFPVSSSSNSKNKKKKSKKKKYEKFFKKNT
jgi:hypothetical protein